MRKTALIVTALLSVAVFQPQVTFASDEIKIDHYGAKEFANTEEALAGLLSTSNEMASIVAAAELDATKMEQIHQISYTTENALAKIGVDKALVAALEEVHLASEEHDPVDLKNKFIAYQAELNTYFAKR